LQRRDFTINTLAIRLDGTYFGELYDPFNGAADIKAGIIRVLHAGSFLDDPTRIFRAVRYEQRYGFTIAPETLVLIPAARGQVAALSAERVRHEFDLMLEESNAASMLARLDELEMLKAVEKSLPWGENLRERLETCLSVPAAPEWNLALRYAGIPFRQVLGYSLWLLDLSLAEIDAIQTRLAFPSAVLESVRAAARLRADLAALSGSVPSKWVERLRGVPLAAIYAVFLVSGEKALETYASHWQHIHPKTNGETLKALGLPPGPAYKKILLRLHHAWLDGEVTSAEQENALLEKLLAA
jgi:tRNA nucleotidyltransferase (CCA-adding enzyme)